MKNMRQIVVEAMAVVGCLIITAAVGGRSVRADIIGGYIDTHAKEMAIVFDAVTVQKVLLGVSLENIRLNGGRDEKSAGKLYVVGANGRVDVSAKNYRDRSGVTIALPKDNFDKVIFLDSRKYIRGGVGFLESEISAFAKANKLSDIQTAARFVKDSKMIFEAIELAAGATKEAYEMDDSERHDIFVSTVGWNAGADAQKMVEDVLNSAEHDAVAPFTGMNDILMGQVKETAVQNLILGVSLVSEGDNGGGVGSVSEGDNGGGVGSVSEGDNGGGVGNVSEGDNGGGVGNVSEGDNGGGVGNVSEGDNGGGVGTVIQGWAGSPESFQLPKIANFTANCAGTVVFMF